MLLESLFMDGVILRYGDREKYRYDQFWTDGYGHVSTFYSYAFRIL
jgi:hypothetical protein